MATNLTNTSMLLGVHEDTRNTAVTFGATATFAYGTLLAVDTSTNKYVPFVVGGVTNGNGVPAAVVLEPNGISRTGAGDVNGALILTAGRVRRSALKVQADGHANNLTTVHIKNLHDQGVIVIETTELAVANNY